MDTTVREFIRNFRKFREAATRGKAVRVKAPEGAYLFTRDQPVKTCGEVLKGLAAYAGRGFLTEAGATAIESSNRKPVPAKSPWDETP